MLDQRKRRRESEMRGTKIESGPSRRGGKRGRRRNTERKAPSDSQKNRSKIRRVTKRSAKTMIKISS